MAVCGGCPTMGCAVCCTIFSIWGVLTLLGVGILWNIPYRNMDINRELEGKYDKAAVSSYIAIGIYIVFIVLCVVRIIFLRAAEAKKRPWTFTPE